MYIICSDLEGVFVPEIWINVSEQTGIDELRLTTRDVSDYDVLMKGRLAILKQHKLTLHNLQQVIAKLKPMPGAKEFVDWVRSLTQLIVVSDTFIEFADPLMQQLGRPTLFCHSLTTDSEGNITGYNLRQKEAKKKVVESLQNLNYKVIAIGDSYNDLMMLRTAELGMLYNPPQSVIDENPGLRIVHSYNEMKEIISDRIESGR